MLSQLDHRYFRGLQGQYNFRLQFRLHEDGKTGAEEYIVRSHGNYLMDRSVSIEVPSLSPGDYLVYISIIGERDTRLPSTEDVVQSECEGREENEKLAQVGQAYDLAHSKAASHLDKLFNVRKKADAKKASELRKKERRKNWEQRHIGRRIAQKQKGKDDAKRAEGKRCKKAKTEAEGDNAMEKQEKSEHSQSQPTDTAVLCDADRQAEGASQIRVDVGNSSAAPSSSSSTGTPQYTPQDSPRSQLAKSADRVEENVSMPPTQNIDNSAVSGGSPFVTAPVTTSFPSIQIGSQKSLELRVHYCSCSSCKPPPKVEDSDGYSSDSPVEDYEDLHDEDDANPTLRVAGSPADTATVEQESEDEDTPDPWNAIAVVGFRVYSKDEGLELRVIMEGGELDQAGMGNLGEADLDNAVTNAGGQRKRQQENVERKGDAVSYHESMTAQSSKEASGMQVTGDALAGGDDREAMINGKDKDNTTPAAGKAAYRTIIERQTSEFDRVMGKLKADQAHTRSSAAQGSPGKAPVEDMAPMAPQTVAKEHVRTDMSTDQETQSASQLLALTNLSGPSGLATQVGDITKAVLVIRSKLQECCRKMFMLDQEPTKDDMQEMSNYLAKLESFPGLDASIIQSTRIHKVMMAILKLECPPKDDGFKFSIATRARALLDDYELTLMTSDHSARVALNGS